MSTTASTSLASGPSTVAWRSDLALARKHLHEHSMTLVLVRDGHVLLDSSRPGIADLAACAAERAGQLQGAVLADRVIGRAAALLIRYLGLAAAYADLTSRPALDELAAAGIPLEYRCLVPSIRDHTGEHLCPFEQLTQGIVEPALAAAAIREVLGRLQQP